MNNKRYWIGIGILAGGILLPYLLLNLLADSTAGGMALQSILNWLHDTLRTQRPLQASDVRSVLEVFFGGVVYAALLYLALRFRFRRYLAAVGIVFVLEGGLDVIPLLGQGEYYGEYLNPVILTSLVGALFFCALYLVLYPVIRMAVRLIKGQTLSLVAGAAAYFAVSMLLILAGGFASMYILAAVMSDASQIMPFSELWSLLSGAYITVLLHLALGVLFYILASHQPTPRQDADASKKPDSQGSGAGEAESDADLDEPGSDPLPAVEAAEEEVPGDEEPPSAPSDAE